MRIVCTGPGGTEGWGSFGESCTHGLLNIVILFRSTSCTGLAIIYSAVIHTGAD